MKKKGLKYVISALVVTMMAGAFVGCSSEKQGSNTTPDTKKQSVSGSITISGSTAMQEFIEKSAKKFQEKNSDATINVQGGGSGQGLTQVSQGNVDIGNSDIYANEKFKNGEDKDLVDHKVLGEGFAVVTSKDVTLTNLTKEQIQNVFSGKVKNWKEIGGPDVKITVIHRPASSGTRATFVKVLLDGNKALEDDKIGIVQDSTGSVMTSIQSTPGSVSYVALANANESKDKVNKVTIDGVEASIDNIIGGKYKFWSWGHMYTKGEAKDLSKAFIEFVSSEDNKDLFDKLGFVQGSKIKE